MSIPFTQCIPFSRYESAVADTGITASIGGKPLDEAAWMKMDDVSRILILRDLELIDDQLCQPGRRTQLSDSHSADSKRSIT